MPNARFDGLSPRLLQAFGDSAHAPEERKTAADLRGFFELGALAFRNLNEAYESWRDRVYTGAEIATEDDAILHRKRFEAWLDALSATAGDIKSREWDGETDDLITLLSEIRTIEKKIKAVLETWSMPTRAANPTFRTAISRDEKARITALTDSGAAGLKVTPQKFEADAR